MMRIVKFVSEVKSKLFCNIFHGEKIFGKVFQALGK